MDMQETVSIPNFFQNKKLFITGGSGFMGKVLIEKILRSCPDVSAIYVLLRPKKGKKLEERVKEITDVALFDNLRIQRPENLKKIVPVFGDVSKLNLGLSLESTKQLKENINIVYHAAASVRFDDSLKDAILMNTRGTREVVLLAKEMKHLEVLIHISTAYTNTNKQIIEEKLYPPHVDWREAIILAENIKSKETLDILTQKYMNDHPNTYVFTKNMAEHVISDLCDGQIPAIILRPSIVTSSMTEPIPGWIDNFNGPVGMLIACGKGIMRTIYGEPDFVLDYVCVDLVIKGLIVATWVKAVEKDSEEKLRLNVYNGSKYNQVKQSLKNQFDLGKIFSWKYPYNNIVWYPTWNITKYYPVFLIKVYLYHILPALLIDMVLKLTGKKPMLLKLQRKIFIANMALSYFMTHEWKIKNEKIMSLNKYIISSDKKDFYFGEVSKPVRLIFQEMTLGAKKYLLKEDLTKLDKDRTHIKRMYILYIIFNTGWYIGLFYLIFFKLEVLRLLEYILNVIKLHFGNI